MRSRVQNMTRTSTLLEMVFLEEGRVADRTCKDALHERKRQNGSRRNTSPATMNPSAAKSSTNGAPKQ